MTSNKYMMKGNRGSKLNVTKEENNVADLIAMIQC